MSDFGEGIINRLGKNSKITLNSDMGRIINYTIGEFLQQENDEDFFEKFFIQESYGNFLDLHGREYNVFRKYNENDEDYKNRIILEASGHLTLDYLHSVHNLDFYSYVPNFDVVNNVLVSDNWYYSNNYMTETSEAIKNILEKKFVIGGEIEWL